MCPKCGPLSESWQLCILCNMDLDSQLLTILRAKADVMLALTAARRLGLRDWAIGAGFIRGAVWDHLCGQGPTPVDDVDVLYHDASDLGWPPEEHAERQLRHLAPSFPWSVRNQARMHLRNGDAPYASTLDAMRHWLETPTCVALRLEDDDTLTILAPFGLEDLFARRIRPTPAGRRRADQYRARLAAKRWHQRWPGIAIE